MRHLTKKGSVIALALVAAGGLIGCGPMSKRLMCQIGVTGTGAVLGAIGGGVGAGPGNRLAHDAGTILTFRTRTR